MHSILRFMIAFLLILGCLSTSASGASALNHDAAADWVFGQSLPQSLPALVALSPSAVAAGSPSFTLTVTGTGFVSGSSVLWNGSARPTTFLSASQLNASISAADLIAGGPFAVTVANPAPGGATAPLTLTLYQRSGADQTADGVLGQPGFTDFTYNNPLLPGGANRLGVPFGIALDPHSGRLYVADSSNHRVLSWPNLPAIANSQAADLVIGQPNFSSYVMNNGGLSAASLNFPMGVAVDAQGNLYVADSGNSRVLEYNTPLTSDKIADRVFGQPNFTSIYPYTGDASALNLNLPVGLALDSQGNLFVADRWNNRVLEYNSPLTSDKTADRVFGQPDFTSHAANNGCLCAYSMAGPIGLAIDAQDRLYVAEIENHRVLVFDNPLADVAAAYVIGQPDFNSNQPNQGGETSASSLNGPSGVAVDTKGNLYLADSANNRVLVFDVPLLSDFSADRVFGQPDFTTYKSDLHGITGLYYPSGVMVNPQGNLYVTDYRNSRVLEYSLLRFEIRLPQILR